MAKENVWKGLNCNPSFSYQNETVDVLFSDGEEVRQVRKCTEDVFAAIESIFPGVRIWTYTSNVLPPLEKTRPVRMDREAYRQESEPAPIMEWLADGLKLIATATQELDGYRVDNAICSLEAEYKGKGKGYDLTITNTRGRQEKIELAADVEVALKQMAGIISEKNLKVMAPQCAFEKED